jgi:small subunit ribosomal protein S9
MSIGKGAFIVNKRPIENYFGRDTLKMVMGQPLELLQLTGKYDISAKVNGGGLSGQAGAIRLGIARCIEKINPDNRLSLKQAGMLTRDSREVERKKYGQPGARKKFQFSKR